MKKLIKYSVAAFTICFALSLQALPSGKVRAFQIWGHMDGVITEWAVNPVTGSGFFKTLEGGGGVTTFGGHHFLEGEMTFYVQAGLLVAAEGTGDWTAANGKDTMTVVISHSLGTTTGIITGGFGRFAGVTGWFTSAPSNIVLAPEFGPNPDDPSQIIFLGGTISYDTKGSGFLTFAEK